MKTMFKYTMPARKIDRERKREMRPSFFWSGRGSRGEMELIPKRIWTNVNPNKLIYKTKC